MPLQKPLRHSNFVESISETLAKCSNCGHNMLSAVKVQKQVTGYKKYSHRHHNSHQLMPLFPKQKKNIEENNLKNRMLTYSMQNKEKVKRKKQKLAFYEDKYNQQINRLSSNLCVKQIDKENEISKTQLRNSEYERYRKNSFGQLKKMRLRMMSPFQRLTYRPNLAKDQHSKLGGGEQLGMGQKKLRLKAKLKPLAQIGNMNMTTLSSHDNKERNQQENLNENKEYNSQIRGVPENQRSDSLMRQLMEWKFRDQDLKPWQNSSSYIEQDQRFASTFDTDI